MQTLARSTESEIIELTDVVYPPHSGREDEDLMSAEQFEYDLSTMFQ